MVTRSLSEELRRESAPTSLTLRVTIKADDDLLEWNYGDYEEKMSDQIHEQRSGWEIFRDGCPDGESVTDVAARVNRVIARIRAIDGQVLVFSYSHFLHVLAACWLGLEGTP
jgi:probable phosphoglycerate mutase